MKESREIIGGKGFLGLIYTIENLKFSVFLMSLDFLIFIFLLGVHFNLVYDEHKCIRILCFRNKKHELGLSFCLIII